MKLLELLIALLSGLAVCIPLVVQLVKHVSKCIQEENWAALLRLVMKLMEEAELKFSTGVNKKAFVMAQLEAAAVQVNYHLTDDSIERISSMIDAMCDMAHIVNGDRGVAND